MAGSDQIAHRIDPGGDTPESAKPVGQTADGATAKSVKDQDAEWGYEPAKGGMAVEAKMGMCIVLILVCAFTFLVYHKYDLKQKALAVANTANSVVDESPAADSAEEKSDDRYSEFNAANGQTASLAGSEVDQNAAPSFAGSSAADVVEADVEQTEMLVVGSPDPQFELSEPEEPFEPQSARDLLAAREDAPESFDAFDAVDFGPGPEVTTGDAFAEPEFSVAAAEPAFPEPMSSEPVSELAAFEPTSLQPAFDEAPFEAFDEPEQVRTPVESFAEPDAVAETTPTFTPLPPASDVVDSGAFDVFDNAAPKALPPVEAAADPPIAVADVQPETNLVSEFGPLATDEPKQLAPLEDVAVTSSFEPDTLPDPLPAAVVADVTPQPASQPFAEFGSEPEVATVVEDTTPLRRPAPMPEFPFSDPAPQPEIAADLAATDEMTDLARRDTFVAMSSSAPDVDVFDREPQIAADAKTPTPIPAPQVARQFSADSSTVGGFTQSDVPLPRESKPAPRPPLGIFEPQDTGSGLSIPVPQSSDGVARFVTPPKQTVQQVSGISEECDICEVQPNDNYWRISQRVYGTARYFSSLALYNRLRIPDPKKLRPGMKVMIPDPKLLEQKYPEFFKDKNLPPKAPHGYFLKSDGSPAYRIGDRETLSEISQKHLGRASRWIQIYRMNQHILKDPNKLKPGTVITLPDDATSVHLAP